MPIKSFRVPTIKEQYNSNSNTFILSDLKPEKAWFMKSAGKQFDDSSLIKISQAAC